MLSQTNF